MADAGDISGTDVRGWAWAYKKVRGWIEMLTPQPDFRGVRQGITHDMPDSSWLHIEVGIRRPWFRRDIPCCEIFLVIYKDWETVKAETIGMHWRSGQKEGTPETHLIFGRPRFIPSFARKDGGDDVLVTSRYWFGSMAHDLEHLPIRQLEFKDGGYKIQYHIRSGKKEWRSGYYHLKIPPAGAGNSQFILE